MPTSKKRKISEYDPEEEARLEASVLGEVQKSDDEVKDEEADSDSETEELDQSKQSQPQERAVWVDEDDECLVEDALRKQSRKLPSGRPEKKYKELMNNKFIGIVGTPKWAKKKDYDDNKLLECFRSNDILEKEQKSTKLPEGTIDLKVLNPINKNTHTEGPFVNSVQFHKSSAVALAAGSSGVLSLFEVNGIENALLATMKFEKFPIGTAKFLGDSKDILAGSMSANYCYSYNMISGKTRRVPLPHGLTNLKNFEVSSDGKIIAACGRLGDIYLLCSRSKELMGTMKMNKKCRSLVFTPDDSKIISIGESNELYVWDVASRTCINKAIDDGCLSAKAVAASPNGQYIATGSKQGAVNIYDTRNILSEMYPQPMKTILNIVTPITKLKFNPTSEILAMASDAKANSFKMVHLPSFKVFSNFPTSKTKMYNPLDIDFSPESGYMSVSNNRGYAYLYRLKRYGNY